MGLPGMVLPSNPQEHLVLHAPAWDACCSLDWGLSTDLHILQTCGLGASLIDLSFAQFGLGKPLDPFLQKANI